MGRGLRGVVVGYHLVLWIFRVFFFFKQKTAYEIYQCDWSSDVCSSDLTVPDDGSRTTDHILEFGDCLGTDVQPHQAVGNIEIGRASCRERV